MNRKLNIAVVGAGFNHGSDGRENWGVRTHLPALKALPDLFNVVAVCTSHMESARESAERFEVPHTFDDYNKLMQLPGLDAVTVVVRPKLHFPVVMAALQAGKHVYCEWPLALSAAQAGEMADLAERKGVVSATGTQGHYMPQAERMREMIKEGFIGRPLLFGASMFVSNYIVPRPAHRQWLFQAAEGGNQAYRAGHMLERVVSTLGEVKELSADLTQLVRERRLLGAQGTLQGDQIDNMNFLLKLANGVSGTLQVSWTSWFGTGQKFEVYGTEGMLMLAKPQRDEVSELTNDPGYLEAGELFGARVDMLQVLRASKPPEATLRDIQPILMRDPDDLHASTLTPYGSAYVVRRAFRAFAGAINGGKAYDPDFRTGTRLHELLEAAELSVREKRWVDTPQRI